MKAKIFKQRNTEKIISGPTRKPDKNAEVYPERFTYSEITNGGEKMAEEEKKEEAIPDPVADGAKEAEEEAEEEAEAEDNSEDEDSDEED